ncbi:hypothetical protein [Vineibacter terrae]|uniref:hypothetical protein n=1 Tax=Vineibacter terrae TaxID=2586908 RepID=UPI001C49A344|nr:hypothetical protein [Vineibacter terrae]
MGNVEHQPGLTLARRIAQQHVSEAGGSQLIERLAERRCDALPVDGRQLSFAGRQARAQVAEVDGIGRPFLAIEDRASSIIDAGLHVSDKGMGHLLLPWLQAGAVSASPIWLPWTQAVAPRMTPRGSPT